MSTVDQRPALLLTTQPALRSSLLKQFLPGEADSTKILNGLMNRDGTCVLVRALFSLHSHGISHIINNIPVMIHSVPPTSGTNIKFGPSSLR